MSLPQRPCRLVSQTPPHSPHPHRGTLFSFFVGGVFSLVTQHASVLEGGDCADSTHRSSCKSLFYGPCNDPPVGNLHPVALQIEPAASGAKMRWRGALCLVAGDSRGPENTHTNTHTHTPKPSDLLRPPSVTNKTSFYLPVLYKCMFFSHPIYQNSYFLRKRSQKMQRGCVGFEILL